RQDGARLLFGAGIKVRPVFDRQHLQPATRSELPELRGNKAVEPGAWQILGEINDSGQGVDRNCFMRKATHRLERDGSNSFVGGGRNLETITVTLLKPALIHAFRVFDSRFTQHSLFTTDPTIPGS